MTTERDFKNQQEIPYNQPSRPAMGNVYKFCRTPDHSRKRSLSTTGSTPRAHYRQSDRQLKTKAELSESQNSLYQEMIGRENIISVRIYIFARYFLYLCTILCF